MGGGGASGRQMVFTVGTFDEDEDSIMVSPQIATKSRNKRSTGSPQVDVVDEEPTEDADEQAVGYNTSLPKEDDDDANNAETQQTVVAEESAHDNERHLTSSTNKRLPLFTMGSNSELSDLGEQEEEEHHHHHHRHQQQHITNSSRNSSSPNPADHRQRYSSSSGGNDKTKSRSLTTDPQTKTINKPASSGGSIKSSTNISDAGSASALKSKGLHACKATTSLSQLYNLAETDNIHEAKDSKTPSVLSPAVSGELVTDVSPPPPPPPPISQDTTFTNNDQHFEQLDDAASLEPTDNSHGNAGLQNNETKQQSPQLQLQQYNTQHAGKGKPRNAPLVSKEGHLKLRKKLTSKKSHIKKATSTAALKSRQRHTGGSGAYRNVSSNSRLLAYSKVAALDDSQIDGSYVDYSSSNNGSGSEDVSDDEDGDDGEVLNIEHRRVSAGAATVAGRTSSSPTAATSASKNAQNLAQSAQSAQSVQNTSAALEQCQASLHSSTATLGGAGQDNDDTATTASSG
ncbi:hypothetical protein GGI12_003980, partial [Dipsacomyces acuminosporus]